MYRIATLAAFALLLSAVAIAQGEEAKTTAGSIAPSADEAKHVPVGTKLPAAQVMTMDEKELTLTELTGGKATALVFYRGGWCPYCNTHLSSLKDAEAPLQELGFTIMAISPDAPAELKKTLTKQELGYALISDTDSNAAKALGIAFNAGRGNRILPVPTVLLVDEENTIQFIHADVNYKKRLENADLLAAAKKVAEK